MEVLRYILFFYSIIGFIVVGGLLFQKSNRASSYLALFILVFTLKQLSFLYETSPIRELYPQLFMITFPLSFLFGPTLLYHFKFLINPKNKISKYALLHLIPFLLLVVVTIYLFSMPGQERILFVKENLFSLIIPVNYLKVVHISLYAIFIFYLFRKASKELSSHKINYIYTILVIYSISALLQASFYASFLRFKYFIVYHVVASTTILVIGYVLYFHPDILQKLQAKYSSSALKKDDKIRILDKVKNYVSNIDNIINQDLNLDLMARSIDERKHHISQTLSQELKTSFNGYVNKKRIEYSKSLLKDSKYDKFKIAAIAIDSGFSNKNTFNRAFIKYNGCTPSEFRKSTKPLYLVSEQ